MEDRSLTASRERKCVDTIGTVLVTCHFPMLKYKYIFRIKYAEANFSKQHSETVMV